MSTTMETPQAVSKATPSHDYHATANVFTGDLKRPIVQRIEPQAAVSLEGRRGGLFNRSVQDVSIEGLISFTRGQTRVSGARSLKHQGWVTLATSVLEGFNAFETLTSDRMVSQLSTDHPYENGHIPSVTFLGTNFGDLRVSGIPIPITLNLGFFGPKPADDQSYLQERTFLTKVKEQTETIAHATGLPKEIKAQYIERLKSVEELIRIKDEVATISRPDIVCSLVKSIDITKVDEGLGVQAFGHVLVIPHFGSVALGEVVVGEKKYEGIERPCVHFELRGMRIKLGCSGDGPGDGPTVAANGRHYP